MVQPAHLTRSRPRALRALLAAAVAVAVAAVAIVFVRDDDELAAVAPTTTTTIRATTTTTVPPPAVPVSTELASPNGEIQAFDAPGGQEIDTVGLWYGYPMTMPVLEDQGHDDHDDGPATGGARVHGARLAQRRDPSL